MSYAKTFPVSPVCSFRVAREAPQVSSFSFTEPVEDAVRVVKVVPVVVPTIVFIFASKEFKFGIFLNIFVDDKVVGADVMEFEVEAEMIEAGMQTRKYQKNIF